MKLLLQSIVRLLYRLKFFPKTVIVGTMTRTGRNNTIFILTTVFLLATVLVLALFLDSLALVPPGGPVVPDATQWHAVAGAVLTTVISFSAAIIYSRLFRRSPSVPVFFVVLFFIFTTMDISKLGQVMIPATAWRHFSPLLARVTIFGHITGALALFAAGLYASVARMQRHGTAMTLGVLIALGLSWAVPIDAFRLPNHLVYTAGFQAPLDAMIQLVLALAVLNFIQAAVASRDRREVMSAGAVALLAVGRELLYYRTEPISIGLGSVVFVTGAVVFAVENYRDYLVG